MLVLLKLCPTQTECSSVGKSQIRLLRSQSAEVTAAECSALTPCKAQETMGKGAEERGRL